MAADQGFERHRKPTRRDAFLETMNRFVPWDALSAVVEPHYPKKGNGRPPIGLERMLRIRFLQHWFNLAAGPILLSKSSCINFANGEKQACSA